MTFQPYKLKYDGSRRINGVNLSEYTYDCTSIVSTIDNGILTVSLAAHGIGKELPYDVKCEIVRHLGINFDLPVEESKFEHVFSPSFGDTHYFTQRMEPVRE